MDSVSQTVVLKLKSACGCSCQRSNRIRQLQNLTFWSSDVPLIWCEWVFGTICHTEHLKSQWQNMHVMSYEVLYLHSWNVSCVAGGLEHHVKDLKLKVISDVSSLASCCGDRWWQWRATGSLTFECFSKWGSDRFSKPLGTREPLMACWPTQAIIWEILMKEPAWSHVTGDNDVLNRKKKKKPAWILLCGRSGSRMIHFG